jgi:hypothetical protein
MKTMLEYHASTPRTVRYSATTSIRSATTSIRSATTSIRPATADDGCPSGDNISHLWWESTFCTGCVPTVVFPRLARSSSSLYGAWSRSLAIVTIHSTGTRRMVVTRPIPYSQFLRKEPQWQSDNRRSIVEDNSFYILLILTSLRY